jgi:hypothetical protein
MLTNVFIDPDAKNNRVQTVFFRRGYHRPAVLAEERASTTRMERKGLTHEDVEADASIGAPQPESEAAVGQHGRLTVMRLRDRAFSDYDPTCTQC